ncbi:DUF500-domain-containing protein [Patellaria atrata CBS 101060]|uniref:DUF500-domain-containing protein n=1 Tax=Patellaria atrata CBS 101060 TaxID=1346257 RepID=A0A9P4VLY1_9PEZI|nr:DUF500-domain-containing protein [Patellaria atrata CBS 101060]
MPTQTFWEKTKTNSKAGFDKVYGWVDKLGPPVNRLSNKLGSEAFWPTTLDIESDKAARILRSFCKDGFYQEEIKSDGPRKHKEKVLKKIPPEVIRNAKGLAIFTTMRTGLWFSGAGGAGVLVAKLPDGSWSPPSGLMSHTVGLGFLAGVDIYDCVLVINTEKALQAFSSVRCTIGGEVSAVAGPVGVGGVVETELHKRQAPVFTYLKSRGLYAGVQVDGTIFIERTDENERFYNQRIPVADILAGKVRHPPYEVRPLLETIKAAQGDTDVDESLLTSEPPPGDYEVEPSDHVFGVPDKEDPDPYGVLALQREGLEIREAGTKERASLDAFAFNPSPSSPIFTNFNRRSFDSRSVSRRSSWRTSTLSNAEKNYSEMSTQTDDPLPDAPPRYSHDLPNGHHGSKMDGIPENTFESATPTKPHQAPTTVISPSTPPRTPPRLPSRANTSPTHSPEINLNGSNLDRDDGAEDDAVEVHEVQQAAAPQFITRARLVTVNKPLPPKLPPRNPIRDRRHHASGSRESNSIDAGNSPLSPSGGRKSDDGFLDVDLNSKDESKGEEGKRVSIIGMAAAMKLDAADESNDRVEGRLETKDANGNGDDGFHSIPPSPEDRTEMRIPGALPA